MRSEKFGLFLILYQFEPGLQNLYRQFKKAKNRTVIFLKILKAA
nr:MAG TPA: hypothetical protein [Caudoviricetes sp.]